MQEQAAQGSAGLHRSAPVTCMQALSAASKEEATGVSSTESQHTDTSRNMEAGGGTKGWKLHSHTGPTNPMVKTFKLEEEHSQFRAQKKHSE